MNKIMSIFSQKSFYKVVLCVFGVLAGGGFFYAANADQIEHTYYLDADSDNYGTVGYAIIGGDCNDGNASIHPNAGEICDGIDNNCSGVADEGVLITYYRDADGDTYGLAASTTKACAAPSGYAASSTDCDDSRVAVHPNATEVCGDQIDNDCDSAVDESCILKTYYRDADSDTYGNSGSATTSYDNAPAGYVIDHTDCNDAKANIHPNAAEVCDGLDNDCDGFTDEDLSSHLYYFDNDSDGYGGSATTSACGAPAGYVNNHTDCNDLESGIHPGAAEIDDNADNDCDGIIDEGFSDNRPATSTCPCLSQLGSFVSCFTQYLNELKAGDQLNGRPKGQILKEMIHEMKAVIKSGKDALKTEKKEKKEEKKTEKKEAKEKRSENRSQRGPNKD
jgi:hypothetical protein